MTGARDRMYRRDLSRGKIQRTVSFAFAKPAQLHQLRPTTHNDNVALSASIYLAFSFSSSSSLLYGISFYTFARFFLILTLYEYLNNNATRTSILQLCLFCLFLSFESHLPYSFSSSIYSFSSVASFHFLLPFCQAIKIFFNNFSI